MDIYVRTVGGEAEIWVCHDADPQMIQAYAARYQAAGYRTVVYMSGHMDAIWLTAQLLANNRDMDTR